MKNFKIKLSVLLAFTIVISGFSISANAAVVNQQNNYSNGTKTVTKKQLSSVGASSVATSDEVPQDISLPSKYSSLEQGNVLKPKAQLYNDCWAYAACATFETKLLKSGENINALSETYVNYWGTGNSTTKGWQRTYQDSGYGYLPVGCFTSWSGPRFESDFPSTTPFSKYQQTAIKSYNPYGATEVEYLYQGENNKIKNAIYKNGSVAASFSCNDEYFNRGMTAYYCSSTMPDSMLMGHTIAVVGWDDNYSKYNFNSNNIQPKNNGAWLIRNSWGENINDNGYFWISYEDVYLFSDIFGESYTINSYMKTDEKVTLYQDEIYGATYVFTPNDYQKATTFINTFDFSDEYTTIDKVIFETPFEDTPFTLYYIPTINSKPTEDTTKWVNLYSGLTKISGYNCIDITNFKLPNTTGAIGVQMSNPADTQKNQNNYYIGVSEWLQQSNGEFIFYNDSHYGDCFVTINGKIIDLMDYYKNELNDTIGGTFVIKAVGTVDDDFVQVLGDADLDCNLNIKDVTFIQKCIADIEHLTRLKLINADFDKNGSVDILDATAIQKALAS